MSTVYFEQDEGADVAVDLREPYVAAVLALIWPGAGHFYQRRFTKGFIFMACILGIYFIGLGMGRGRCVYASWKENDKRWQYIFQVGVGLPALPAVIQSAKTRGDADPYFVIAERYPEGRKFGAKQFKIIKDMDEFKSKYADDKPIKDGFMAPPHGEIDQDHIDVLGAWHREMGQLFEIGTLYCIVAGLLNWLAVYDAFAGPAIVRKKKSRTDEESEPENESPSPPKDPAKSSADSGDSGDDKKKPRRKKIKKTTKS